MTQRAVKHLFITGITSSNSGSRLLACEFNLITKNGAELAKTGNVWKLTEGRAVAAQTQTAGRLRPNGTAGFYGPDAAAGRL
jgi:hypothetical protein